MTFVGIAAVGVVLGLLPGLVSLGLVLCLALVALASFVVFPGSDTTMGVAFMLYFGFFTLPVLVPVWGVTFALRFSFLQWRSRRKSAGGS